MNPSLQQLLQRPDVWRQRDRRPGASARGCATGFAALDQLLHGGWPRGALTELLLAQPGCGELFLLAPLLAELSRQQQLQVWINPPFIPYAPALTQRGIALDTLLIVRGDPRHHLWACEQALRSAACAAVLYWPTQALRYSELRKLQVAAAAETASGFLFRDQRAAQQTSPAVLRLQLEAAATQLSLRVIKQRGREGGQTVLLPRESALLPTPAFNAKKPAQRAVKIIATNARTAALQSAAQSVSPAAVLP